MNGNNEIHLNQATMMEAAQMYFDSTFREGKSPKVGSIKMERASEIFVVKVSSPGEGELPPETAELPVQ